MKKNEMNISFITRITIINILLNIILCEIECEKGKPIIIETQGTQCQSVYCSDSQFESGYCIKSNSIIKTQWLNNIILVGEDNFRYTNFMTSNGKTLFYTSPKPVSSKRIYFGINSIGEPIFKDSNNNSIYIYQKESRDSISHQHETIAGPVKIKGDINQDKTYFMTIGKSKTNTEIFDYENYENELKILKYNEIINHETLIYLGNIIDLKEDNKQYYISW